MKKEFEMIVIYFIAFLIQIFGIIVPFGNKVIDLSEKVGLPINNSIIKTQIGIVLLAIFLSIILWKIVIAIEKKIF